MPQDLEKMLLDELCDYIESMHHTYIRKTLRSLEPQLEILARNEGDKHPLLNKLLQRFSAMADEMSIHIQKEGNVLFPYIKKLALFSLKKGPKPEAHFSSLSVPVQRMEDDHGDAIGMLYQIRSITADFSEDGMSQPVKEMYQRLQEFEVYIKEHIEVENKILFRKAINLEAEMYDNR